MDRRGIFFHNTKNNELHNNNVYQLAKKFLLNIAEDQEKWADTNNCNIYNVISKIMFLVDLNTYIQF